MFYEDINEYLYEHDPNFDFNQSTVDTPRNTQRKEKKEKIGMYYQTKMLSDSRTTLDDTYSIDDFVEEDSSFIDEEEIKKEAILRENKMAPKRKNISDIHLTRSLEVNVEPAKMRKVPQRKLKEICDDNNYVISMKDFESTKILIGRGSFGEVYLVR